MLATKIRTTAITLAAALSFAGAALVPAAAQAQWHTICFSGHCTTHTNFTIGGVSPCGGISSTYGSSYETLLDAVQDKKEQALKVQPEMTQAEAQVAIEEAEARVHLAEIASFEWGCDVAIHASSSSVVGLHLNSSQLLRLKLDACRTTTCRLGRLRALSPSLSAR
jgi:hypothetical protein